MVRQITLQKELELFYCDAQADWSSITLPSGSKANYEKIELLGWIEHKCWVEKDGKRFVTSKFDYKTPLIHVSHIPGIKPGTKVLVDGRYEGEYVGVVETNTYTHTKMHCVHHLPSSSLGMCKTYQFYVQVLESPIPVEV